MLFVTGAKGSSRLSLALPYKIASFEIVLPKSGLSQTRNINSLEPDHFQSFFRNTKYFRTMSFHSRCFLWRLHVPCYVLARVKAWKLLMGLRLLVGHCSSSLRKGRRQHFGQNHQVGSIRFNSISKQYHSFWKLVEKRRKKQYFNTAHIKVVIIRLFFLPIFINSICIIYHSF